MLCVPDQTVLLVGWHQGMVYVRSLLQVRCLCLKFWKVLSKLL